MGNKFEIVEYTKDDDSYMYSDTDYYWHVASVQTGDELAIIRVIIMNPPLEFKKVYLVVLVLMRI